jgi:signal transduction histidine kinase
MSVEDLICSEAFLQRGGRCGKLMRLMDWQRTPLGEPVKWSPGLKASTSIALHSSLPIIIWWDKKLVMLYNDAALDLLGPSHPEAMGRPAREVLPEIQKAVLGMFETGEAGNVDEQLLITSKAGRKQETYFSWYHSPIHDDSGKIMGVFTTFLDRTEIVLERRLTETLVQLSRSLISARTKSELYQHISRIFYDNPADFPFALLYEIKEATAALKSSSGASDDVAPENIDLTSDDAVWPVRMALKMDQHLLIELESDIKMKLPSRSWQEPPEKSVLFPIRFNGRSRADAILIFGINPYTVLSDELMAFHKLIVAQIADRLGSIERQGKSMQVAFEQSAEAAEQLERLRYISNHDLQEPLRKIRTFTHMLYGALKHKPQATKHLEKIDDAATQMSILIQNVTNYSKFSINDELLQHVDLTSALETALDELTEVIQQNKAAVKYNNLPQVRGSRRQLIQLFKNLLENSFQFTETPPVVVIDFNRVTQTKDNISREYVELIYTDNGIEFENRHTGKPFLVFQKHGDENVSDNGAGFAVCRKIIDNHYGSLDVLSRTNQGSIFRILLPVEFHGDRTPVTGRR